MKRRRRRAPVSPRPAARDRPAPLLQTAAAQPPAHPLPLRLLSTASLAAFGVGAVLALAVHESALQALTARVGAAVALVAISLGAALGLWLPRRYVQRRLGVDPRGALRGAVPQRASSEFAAALAAAALGLAALLALAVIVTSLPAERFRAGLVSHWLLPPTIAVVVVLTPLLLAAGAAAFSAAAALVALHGWLRLGVARRGSTWSFWICVLFSAGLAIAVRPVEWAGLLGVIALPVSAALAGVRVTAKSVDSSAAARSFRPAQRADYQWIAAAAVQFALLGFYLPAGLPHAFDAAETLLLRCVAALSATILALLAATRTLRWLDAAPRPAAVLLSAIAICAVPSPLAPTARFALAGAACALLATIAARRIARRCGSVQYALAVLGAWSCAALAAGALLCAAMPAPQMEFSAGAMRWAQELRTRYPRLVIRSATPDRLGVDLFTQADVLLLDAQGIAPQYTLSPAFRRLLQRIPRGLLRGGRTLLVGAGPQLESELARRRQSNQLGWRVTLIDGDSRVSALAFGSDAPDWLGAHQTQRSVMLQVEPWP